MRSILPQLYASALKLEARINASEAMLDLPLGTDFIREARLHIASLRARLVSIRIDITKLEAAYAANDSRHSLATAQ